MGKKMGEKFKPKIISFGWCHHKKS